MSSPSPKIDSSWLKVLSEEFQKDYFFELKGFLTAEKQNFTIYPPGNRIFAAYDHTPFHNVKVVIIGQDPYHGPGQANGLCFSVAPGIKPPPSLVNIFKELNADLNLPIPGHGDLSKWADQGVLLLNAFLTVRHKEPASHRQSGWEEFTDATIKRLSDEKNGLVFLLWGSFARSKKQLIDLERHHVLEAPHPSPFSAYTGFFGCKHFSITNSILQKEGKEPIDWSI